MNPARQKHEDPLELGSLPLLAPPRDGWPAVQAALLDDHRRRGVRRLAWSALAAAATLVLALGVAWHSLPGPLESEEAPGLAAAAPAPPTAAGSRSLDALIGLSQELESRLRLIRAEAGDLPSDRLVYRVELEDLVAQVDAQLSQDPDSLALWTQRVNLLVDLERLYEDSLRRDYQRMASL